MADQQTIGQIWALVVVLALILLTAIGSAEVMFWVSLASLALLFTWFVADRKLWLATVAGVAFLITAFSTASKLF